MGSRAERGANRQRARESLSASAEAQAQAEAPRAYALRPRASAMVGGLTLRAGLAHRTGCVDAHAIYRVPFGSDRRGALAGHRLEARDAWSARAEGQRRDRHAQARGATLAAGCRAASVARRGSE